MHSAFTLLIIIGFLALAFFAHTFLQAKIKPRESFFRLLLYFIAVFLMIIAVSALMIFLITWFFPGERIKQ